MRSVAPAPGVGGRTAMAGRMHRRARVGAYQHVLPQRSGNQDRSRHRKLEARHEAMRSGRSDEPTEI